jgi:hypothetical protein
VTVGTFGAKTLAVALIFRQGCSTLPLLALVILMGANAGAVLQNAADNSIEQFLAQDDTQPRYRALRRLEATNGSRTAWLEALTEYSPATGFQYQITAEGGSDLIRKKVLSAVLEAERDVIAHGETARSSLALDNYSFQANGIDSDGFANITLLPRRRERVLVAGTMFLRPDDGDLVRLQGRLAKNPSFWVKDVDIVRRYERIGTAVLPVALDTKAHVRFLGVATLRMTYVYSEVDGRPILAVP